MNSTAEKVRVLIVDDETHARRAIRRLLECEKEAYFLDEACDGTEAAEKIASFAPDLLILDIEMPGVSGFDLLRAFPNRSFEVVFVTAYSNFAIQAFDSHACDYLLKPVHPSRFATALARAKERLDIRRNRSASENRAMQSVQHLHYLDSFFVRQGARATQIFSAEIITISSLEGGTEILTDERVFSSDHTLAHFEEHLDPVVFRRVRRNVIVHRRAITKVIHLFPMIIVMRHGSEVVVAKERRAEVRQWLNDEHPDLKT
jgi:two-component system LytT family response regulator